MGIIAIDASNIESEHICCALGGDADNRAAAETKKAWLRKRFVEGLSFKRLDERGKVFIEYLPVAKAWKPLFGDNFMLIDCLWVSGRFKGRGYSRLLLAECIKDAKARGMDGVCVVSAGKKKPFLTDKSFFAKAGFVVADTAPPYFELLALPFKAKSVLPAFNKGAKDNRSPVKKGLSVFYSHQCPFMEKYANLIVERASARGMDCTVTRYRSLKEAQAGPCPFGTLGIYYNGKFVGHELMSEGKVEAFLDGLGKGTS